MRYTELTQYEWEVLKSHIRIRSTGADPVIYTVDELGQVHEIGSIAPVHDLVKAAPAIYKKLEERYSALIESASGDFSSYMKVLTHHKRSEKGPKYSAMPFPQWLKIALKLAKETYIPDCDLVMKEAIPYISNSIEKLSYYYFDKNTKPGDCTLWNHYAYRFQNTDEWRFFRAWIWTIFDESIRNRQILYIYDPQGSSGKSTLVNALCEFLGKASATISGSTLLSGFPLEHIAGKRFITYPEVKLSKFTNLEVIKNITGGDTVSIYRKNKPTLNERVFAKILMTSNDAPEINFVDQSARSRLVVLKWRTNEELSRDPVAKEFLRKYIKFIGNNPVTTNIGYTYLDEFGLNPEKRLVAELPAFLHECKNAYEMMDHSNNEIKIPESVMKSIQEDYKSNETELLDLFFQEFCVLDQDATTKRTDFRTQLCILNTKSKIPTNLREVLRLFEKYLPEFLKRHPQIKSLQRGNAWYYSGIAINKSKLSDFNFRLDSFPEPETPQKDKGDDESNPYSNVVGF